MSEMRRTDGAGGMLSPARMTFGSRRRAVNSADVRGLMLYGSMNCEHYLHRAQAFRLVCRGEA